MGEVIDIISYMFGDHMYMLGDHTILIPYNIWGDHKSHVRHEDTSHVGGSYIHVGDHMIPVS